MEEERAMEPGAPPLAGGGGRDGHDLADLLGEGVSLAARLERWAAEVRVEEAARRRSQERWLLQQAEEEGTFAGVLVDLAERGAQVLVLTRSGGRHAGRVGVVGADFVAVRRAGASEALVRTDVIAAVRTQPGEPPTAGDHRRPDAIDAQVTLAEVLARLAGERERATLVLGGAGTVAGTLRAVGEDVVAVRLDAGTPPATVYVRLPAVAEVLLGT